MTDKSSKNHSFQAEVSKLLDLVANSLYSEREIFLRELISNSADACEKLRYQSLSKKNILGDDTELKIHIRVSKKKKTIEIQDNGIGMTVPKIQTVSITLCGNDIPVYGGGVVVALIDIHTACRRCRSTH